MVAKRCLLENVGEYDSIPDCTKACNPFAAFYTAARSLALHSIICIEFKRQQERRRIS